MSHRNARENTTLKKNNNYSSLFQSLSHHQNSSVSLMRSSSRSSFLTARRPPGYPISVYSLCSAERNTSWAANTEQLNFISKEKKKCPLNSRIIFSIFASMESVPPHTANTSLAKCWAMYLSSGPDPVLVFLPTTRANWQINYRT